MSQIVGVQLCRIIFAYKVSRNYVQRFKRSCIDKLYTTTFKINGQTSMFKRAKIQISKGIGFSL